MQQFVPQSDFKLDFQSAFEIIRCSPICWLERLKKLLFSYVKCVTEYKRKSKDGSTVETHFLGIGESDAIVRFDLIYQVAVVG